MGLRNPGVASVGDPGSSTKAILNGLFYASFSDYTGSLLGYTPDFSANGNTLAASVGTFNISGGTLTSTSTSASGWSAVVDLGLITYSLTVTVSLTSGGSAGILLRYVDDNNYLYLVLNQANSTVTLYTLVASVLTTIGTVPFTIAVSQPYLIEANVNTSVIVVKINSLNILSVNSTVGNTATKAGIRASSTGSNTIFDSLIIAPREVIKTAVFFGDSITVGNVSTQTYFSWAALTGSNYGLKVINAGISGTVLQNSASETNNGRDRYVTDVINQNPDYVFIQYGTNDSHRTSTAYTIADFLNDYGEIITGLIAAGISPKRIYLGTVPYRNPLWFSTSAATKPATALGGTVETSQAYGLAVQNVANAYGCWYVDSYTYMANNGGNSLISSDYLHPNDLGHAAIAAAFKAIYQLPSSATVPEQPKPPTALTVTSPSTGQLNVSFTSPATGTAPTSYDVQYQMSTALNYDWQTASSVSASPATITGLTSGNYFVQVRSKLASITSGWVAISTAVTVAGASATITDTFTASNGTTVESRAADSGQSWTKQTRTGANGTATIGSNSAYAGTVSSTAFYTISSGVLAYTAVEADFVQLSAVAPAGQQSISIAQRVSSSADTQYYVTFGGTTLTLNRAIAGSVVTLTSVSFTIANGSSNKIKYEITESGATRTHKVYVDGVENTSLGSTDNNSSLNAVGLVGMRLKNGATATSQGASIGLHLDNFKVYFS